MNLQAYDTVNPPRRTWINPNYAKLYSIELPKYKYYIILKKFNKRYREYDYYLALSDTTTENYDYKSLTYKFGKHIVSLLPIWNEIKHKLTGTTDINIILDDKQADGVVFKLDI